MQLSDSAVLNAPRERVWETLIDPQAIGSCIPGLTEVEVYDDGRSFGGLASIKVGGSSLSFPARVTWVERDGPQGGRLRASAKLMGHEISGDGVVSLLSDELGKTIMDWQVDVTMPPGLAANAFVMKMAGAFATRFIQAFFQCVRAHLASV